MEGKGVHVRLKSVCKNKVVMIVHYLPVFVPVHAVILNVLLKVTAMEKIKTFHDYMIDFKNQVYIISLCKHFTNDTFFQLREQ